MTSRGSFTHLHVHTEYSMLDGAARIGETVAAAAADGQPAIGITDHGNMYGILDFYKECRNQGIKPILGTEAYMAHDSRHERPPRRGRVDDTGGEADGGKKLYYHLTLLAENNTGYRNLIQLASRAFMEGYYYKPRVDWETLADHSEGLIATTGCLGGHVLQSLLHGDMEGAVAKAGRLQEIFGRDNLFIELQDHGLPAQHKTNPQLLEIARRIKAPLLATNDSHYVRREDAVAQDALLCVQTGSLMSDPDRFKFEGEEHFLKSAAEMRGLFAELPESCDNTLWVAERCDVEIDFGQPQLPNFPLPEGFESDSAYLRHLTFEGARQRWGERLPEAAVERLAYELKVIDDMGFSSYFLIVWDLIDHARRSGIRVGPGRGSAAGCAVAYCLRITDLDPIRYDLLFERFLNPSRISMPDIDMDFDSRFRDEMIRYAAERYGRDHVAQIVTFSTIKARAAVRDAARVLGHPYGVGDKVAKAMPPLIMGRDTPLYACLEPHPKYEDGYKMAAELREMYEADPDIRQVVDVAKGLEGLRRQDGIHAAAVVITNQALTDHLPIQRKPENGQSIEDAPVVTQYEMHGVEELGLLKMDFLGLRNLDVITDTLELIRATRGVDLDIDDVPLDDRPTYELLCRGDSIGVFQLEGGPMRALMRSLAPSSFEDVAALVALYRPGPMAANMHNDYADRKNHRKPVEYLHADAEEVLGDTYGLCLTGDTIMHEALTGRPTRLDEVDPASGFWVQAVDDDLRTVVRQVTHWVDNGRRDTVRLRLANGMELTGTPDHPVLTEHGWRGLGDLGGDDHVAVPHNALELSDAHRSMGVRWVQVDAVEPAGVQKVYDITVDEVHNFVANGMVVHNCIYQESMMRIAQRFAGYSLAEADNLRKACLPTGTRVLTKSRGYVPIEKLANLADRRVQTIDTTACTSRFDLVDDVWSVGLKPVYRLTTSTGYSIAATTNHPFLVEGTWRQLGDIAVGDLVAVAAKTETDGGSRVTTAEVDLAALLISEGLSAGHTPDPSTGTCGSAHFSNTDPELLDAFRAAFAEHFGYEHTRSGVYGGVTQLLLTGAELRALVPILGGLGLSADKQIPYCVINAPLHKVERFLGLFFCADGWADPSGVHYGSRSRRVCLALKRMLLRCGVLSNLHSRDGAGHGRHWTLSIADKGQAKRFARLVEPHLTAVKARKVDRWLIEWGDRSSPANIGIPASFVARELARRQAVTGKSARRLGVDTGGYTRSRVLHRSTLDGLLHSERLEDLRTGDLVWDTVTSIEHVGERECFDFQMADPERPYAVVEDFLVHNCGKKVRELIAKERIKFVEGCERTGYGADLGTRWFDIIEPFADYAFNKSHAYGYGFVAYQTAYLKANYPAEYLAALLTSVKTNLEKAAVYLAECRNMGITVDVPDVNRSASDFTPVVAGDAAGHENRSIIFGLSAVRNVGEGLVAHIVAERDANGPYADFYDFCQRVDMSVLNKRTVESLTKAGAFDDLGHPRKGLLTVFEQIVDNTIARRRERDMGIMTLFGDAAGDDAADFERVAIPNLEFDKRDRLAFEKEMLGLYVSDHPLMGAETVLSRRTDCPLDELAEADDGALKAVGGVITGLQRKWTRKGDLMAVFVLEDLHTAIEVMVFPRTMTEHGHKLADDSVVVVKGRVDKRDDTPKFIAQAVDVVDVGESHTEPLRVRVPPQLLSESTVNDLKQVLSDHPGDAPVFLHLGDRQVLRLPEQWNVDTGNGLIGHLRVLLGPTAILAEA